MSTDVNRTEEPHRVQEDVINVVENMLDSASLQDLPVVIRFLFQVCTSKEELMGVT